ncbi:hypothetical protein A2U01_0088647, partial [Trifolium medium]|nr:hypothetical protein [Trifolium medium]
QTVVLGGGVCSGGFEGVVVVVGGADVETWW